jgi:hypothetical protein
MTATFASFVLLGASLGILAPTASEAQSGSPAMDAIAAGYYGIHSSRQAFLDSLTPRQRTLLERIEHEEEVHTRQTGCAIPVTRGNLAGLMSRIGAVPADAAFVHSRMVAAVRLDAAFRGFDRDLAVINAQTCRTLGLFCEGAAPISTCRPR